MERLVIIMGPLFLLGIAATGALASSGSYSPPADSAPSSAGLAPASPTPTCPPSWTVVTSPTLELRESQFYGINALSSSDVWAVGIYLSGTVSSTTKPESRLLPHRDHT